MVRKKRTLEDSDNERVRTKMKKLTRHEKGKKMLKEKESSSESEDLSKHKGKKKMKETTSSSESDDYTQPEVKKRKKVCTTTSESEDSDSTETDSDSSRGGRRKSKHRGKKSRRRDARKKMVLKGKHKDSMTDYSDCEAVPQNCFGDITLKKRNTYYRSNIKTTIKELKSVPFNEAQVYEMKKTPFWLLFNAIHASDSDTLSARCHKFEKDIRAILLRFNVKYSYFALAKKIFRVSKIDVHLIMGVCGGDERIPVKGGGNSKPEWIRRLFRVEIETLGDKFVLYKNQVFAKFAEIIDKEGEEIEQDVARLTICYLLAGLLSPLRSAAIPWHVTKCLEIIEDAHCYDWCSYIVDTLHSQIRGSKNLKTGGCAMLLPFWLCEHTKLVRPVDETAFPRFLRWDLNDLNDRLDGFDLKRLKAKHLRKDTLKPSRGEKNILQTMNEFWEGALERGNTQLDGQVSGSLPKDRMVPGTCDEAEQLFENNSTPGASGTDSVAIMLADATLSGDQIQSKKDMCSVSGWTLEKATPYDGGHVTNNYCKFFDAEPNFGMNFTQDFRRAEEARKSVQRVIEDIKCIDEEKDLGQEDMSCPDDVVQLKKMLETARYENEKLKIREAELCQENNALNEQIQKLKAENDSPVHQSGVSSELTPTQFFGDPENLARIKVMEEQAMAGIKARRENTEQRDFDQAKDGGDLITEKMQIEQTKDVEGLISDVRNIEYEGDKYVGDPVGTENEGAVLEQCADLEGDGSPDTRSCMVTEGSEGGVDEEIEGRETNADMDIIDGDESLGGNNLEDVVVDTEGLIVAVEAGVGNVITDCASKENEKDPVTPSSIVRIVKERTLVNARKAKEITPQPSTNELLIDVDAEEFEEQPPPNDPPELYLDEDMIAVQNLSGDAIEFLKKCWAENRSRKLVWKGAWSFADVMMSDALAILHHASLSTWVVDSWSEMLLRKYSERDGILRTKIFAATCWEMLTSASANKEKTLKKFIDDPLSEITYYSQLLFPLLSSGPSGVGKDAGNHWTLLRLDLRQGHWRFYNSNRPRTAATVDVHLQRACVIIDYVEPILREHFKSAMPSHKLLKNEQKMPVQSACPQQDPGSVDCGVVLCQNMEYLVAEKGLKNGKFLPKHSGDYRCRMIEWFTNPVFCEI